MRFQSRVALATMALVAMLGAGAGVSPAMAASSEDLQGKWLFTLEGADFPPMTVPMTFSPKGKGSVSIPPTPLPMVYREDSATFSLAVEVPETHSFLGAGLSIICRGPKTDGKSVTGVAIIVSDLATAGSPALDPLIGLDVLTGTCTGVRQ